jgi:DNA invertase Pin-like site-specific DNA recombinase
MTSQGEPPPICAAIYLRISQDHTGEGLGVARQLEDCQSLADSLGWEVVEVYRDNDISAVSAKPRPEYRRLLKAMERGEVDGVVAWHADRLYRRMGDLEELLGIVRASGTQIATVKAGRIDLTTDSGQMIAEILASVAGYEGRAKATRWKRAWQQGRESGAPAKTGSRLFGYTRDGEVIEWEADYARLMAEDIIDGVPILTVARKLESEGILTTRNSVWRPGTVRQYLSNPRLAGYSTLKGEIVAEGKWEPILDRDTWETVRALLNSRARGHAPRVSLLNGLLYCGKCEHRMITSGSRGKRTYRCPNRPGMPGCGGVSSYAEPVEEIVEAYAKARLADPRVRANLARLSTTVGPEILSEINGLESRIRELEASLDEPGTPVPTILRAITRAKERLEECQRKITTATPVRLLPESAGAWPDDLERRRHLIELVVSEVKLLPATQRGRVEFDTERVKIARRETSPAGSSRAP